jgi:3-hydroxyisobutyrate dehydrogenase-like beta-hydroxyacid dehydrogenase
LIPAIAAGLGAPVPSVEAASRYVDAAMDAGWQEQNASALIKAVAVEGKASLSK